MGGGGPADTDFDDHVTSHQDASRLPKRMCSSVVQRRVVAFWDLCYVAHFDTHVDAAAGWIGVRQCALLLDNETVVGRGRGIPSGIQQQSVWLYVRYTSVALPVWCAPQR